MKPTQRISHGLNIHRVLHVGTWNVLDLTEDQQLPYLSNEARRMRVDTVDLSETRRPGNGEISSRSHTDSYWSGMENGTHLGGGEVAVSISSRLQ